MSQNNLGKFLFPYINNILWPAGIYNLAMMRYLLGKTSDTLLEKRKGEVVCIICFDV